MTVDVTHIDTLLVGTIDFDDSLNEGLVGTVNFGKSIGKCKILIYSSEGPIPHFHIENKNSGFDCCIKIYSSEYFSHGHHTDKLTKSQASILNDYLKSQDLDFDENPNWSVWRSMCVFWKRLNPECIFPDSKKANVQPDYTKLK